MFFSEHDRVVQYHPIGPAHLGKRRSSGTSENGRRRRPTLDCCLKWALLLVVCVAILLTVVTIHGFYPVEDPIAPVSILDKISLLFGVHEQSAIAVINVELFSSTVFVYVFHRHISDGSFHVASETKTQILPGLFQEDTETPLEQRVQELLKGVLENVPASCIQRESTANPKTPIVLAKISPEILDHLPRAEIDRVSKHITSIFTNSTSIQFDPDLSLGTLSKNDAKVLQWFAINLLDHALKRFRVSTSAVILDVGASDIELTFAVSSRQTLPSKGEFVATTRLSAFGHLIKLVTIRYRNLGLYDARFFMLSQHSSENGTLFHSECMNPISQAHWTYKGSFYEVVGKEKPDFELVKERNGPFAGKKVNRPVAHYQQCHNLAAQYISAHLPDKDASLIKDLVRGRKVFMEGLLLEKAMGRGLTLPYRGGDVRMKLFIDSLQHACKVPNTDQPFGCVDLMYLATLVDKALAFKQGSVLYSSCDIGGMTGEWPLAAAFHVYENGL